MILRKLALAALLALASLAAATAAEASSLRSGGAVYVLSNGAAGNSVLVYARSADGSLTPAGSYATGGNGTGAGLGDQGALVLSADGGRLFVVNAASNSVSELQVTGNSLKLRAVVPSNGTTPLSVTVHGDLLYVLNGSGSISGYRLAGNGLEPIAGSTRQLGAGTAGPAQIEFSPDGSWLAVTEKASSTIDVFPVGADGVAGAPVTTASAGGTPFGFDIDAAGHLLVSEAVGSASSYSVGADGHAGVISGAVVTHQAAPCWLIATKDGRFAYTANAGAGNISRFAIGSNGSLTLLDAGTAAASFGAGSHPLDLGVSPDGGFLYNLTDGLHQLNGFAIGADGTLTPVGSLGGLPVGAEGIAVS
jgi:6-phosphogluconolactonase